MRIAYPIAVDSDHAVWEAFGNQYWPALYFVDARGRVRSNAFGEGEYERSERTIQQLLAEAGRGDGARGLVAVEGRGVEAAADWDSLRTTETYVGCARTQHLASPGGVAPSASLELVAHGATHRRDAQSVTWERMHRCRPWPQSHAARE
jgi:hypothetical protein